MSEESVIFTNIMYLGNAGDYWSSPIHYYDFSFINHVQIHFMDIFRGASGREGYEKYKYKDKLVIIGGGGLLTTKGDHLQNTLEYLVENNKVILWGIGSNTCETIAWDILKHPNVLLAGIRDTAYTLDQRYLPCVSCKHKLLDRINISPVGIGIIEHTDFPINLPVEKIKNDQKIDDLIEFISSKECIISTTFHGVYWSQLLNKKVAMYQPDRINSKMVNMRHRVPSCNEGNYLEVLKHTSRSEGLLEESRYLNDVFYSEVKEILKWV